LGGVLLGWWGYSGVALSLKMICRVADVRYELFVKVVKRERGKRLEERE
jgi:hypothetical protein